MSKLLKADFKRLFQDKLLMVMGIIAVAFAFVTPVLYWLLFSGGELLNDPMFSNLILAKNQFFGAFSIGNNFGLIAPVLLAITLYKDFSFGTVRNKVIAGHSRSAIFLSMFTVCAVILIGVMMLHAFATLGISLVFFDYQAEPLETKDIVYFLTSLFFEVLVLLFVAALLSWLCGSMKNVGLTIVLYIAIAFALVLLGSIIQTVFQVMELTGGDESTIEILRFLDRINVGTAATRIGMGTGYTAEDVLYLTVPASVGIAGFLGLGLIRFNKKDLK